MRSRTFACTGSGAPSNSTNKVLRSPQFFSDKFEPRLRRFCDVGQAASLPWLAASWQLAPLERRERDSNPRTSFDVSGFQDRCNQPLCHPSGALVSAKEPHQSDILANGMVRAQAKWKRSIRERRAESVRASAKGTRRRQGSRYSPNFENGSYAGNAECRGGIWRLAPLRTPYRPLNRETAARQGWSGESRQRRATHPIESYSFAGRRNLKASKVALGA